MLPQRLLRLCRRGPYGAAMLVRVGTRRPNRAVALGSGHPSTIAVLEPTIGSCSGHSYNSYSTQQQQQQQEKQHYPDARHRPSPTKTIPPTLYSVVLNHVRSRTLQHPQQRQSKGGGLYFSTSTNTTPNDIINNHNDTIPFLLADIGEGIKEVELLQWFVQPGDTVQQFDKICEVQSDKATVEITSRYDGTIVHLPHQVGDLCPVGQPLLYLSNSNDSSNESSLAATTTATAIPDSRPDDVSGQRLVDPTEPELPSTPRLSIPTIASQFRLKGDDDNNHANSINTVHTSPAVRKLGRDYNLNLTTLQGRGPRGRLLKHDVVTYLKEQGLWRGENENNDATLQSFPETLRLPPQPQSFPNAAPGVTPMEANREPDDEPIITLRGYQRMMAKTMTAALQTPHMGFADEVVCNALLECRQQLNQATDAQLPPIKISVLALLIQAVSAALRHVPQLNAVVVSSPTPNDDTNHPQQQQWQYQIRRDHNIGIAMDTPRGLVVPVIAQCQRLSLLEIQQQLDRLKQVAATPEAKFSETDLATPTFTLSNIGSLGHGGTYMHPVLAPPALCLGALGAMQRQPRFVDSSDSLQIYAAQIMTVSWCADHRFVDGATLARFHGQFRQYVEHPLQLWLRQSPAK